MAAEIRVVNKDGTDGEILPDWSNLTFSQDLLNPGALTFDYPVIGRNADLLTHGVILAARLDGQEPINGRFTYFEGTGARLGDNGEAYVSTYGCTSNSDRFGKMMLAPAFGSQFADENIFDFKNQTPGWLVKNAIDNSMSRGYQMSSTPQEWLNHPLTTFDALKDSSGNLWPAAYDVKFDPSKTVTDVLTWVVQNGFAEPQMYQNDFRLLDPANNGRDLSLGNNPVVLQTGRDFIEATYQTTSKDLVNALLVLGDDSSCVWVYDTDSIAQYGYREGSFTVSGASSQGTLTAAGQAYLFTRKVPRYSYTYSVSALYLEQTNSNPRPFIDYQVGDSVLILDGVATSVQRIRLLSATWPNAYASTVNLTVNDWFSERDAELDRRLSRLGI